MSDFDLNAAQVEAVPSSSQGKEKSKAAPPEGWTQKEVDQLRYMGACQIASGMVGNAATWNDEAVLYKAVSLSTELVKIIILHQKLQVRTLGQQAAIDHTRRGVQGGITVE